MKTVRSFANEDGETERYRKCLEDTYALNIVEAAAYAASTWTNSISVVSQEPVLFTRSVQEIIKYGKEDASDGDIHAAAKLASADDFILNLPRGYETDAGQKQCIAIARALIQKPQILVLDDATSSLDTESEHKVYSALQKELKNCTVLLSGVENADHIIFLREGEVAEEGNHEQLLAKHGFSAEFVKQQNTSIHHNTGDVTNSIQ